MRRVSFLKSNRKRKNIIRQYYIYVLYLKKIKDTLSLNDLKLIDRLTERKIKAQFVV
jgi:hypothetical protein